MKHLKLFIFFLIGLLVSCASDDPVTVNPDEGTTNNSTRITLDEAIKNAEDFFSLNESCTRNSPRRISSVQIISSEKFRSEENCDTLLYFVNFADNRGYALLGSDKRMYDIYAISSDGNVNLSEIKNLPGLKSFFKNAISHAHSSISDDSKTRGFGWTAGNGTTIETIHEVKPLIHPNSAKWGQLYPFNKYCYTSDGLKSYPGCLPVAVAIYLSYFQWPTNYAGEAIDWDYMVNQNKRDAVAKFLKLLGISALLDCEYTAEYGALSKNERINITFNELGYKLDHSLYMKSVKSDFDKFMNVLRFGNESYPFPSPVLVTASNSLPNKSGHAFIVDGEISRRYNIMQNWKIIQSCDLAPLLHIVWGWEGRYNGYFVYNAALGLVNDEVLIGDDENDDGKKLPEGHTYQDYVFFGGMYPRNL